MKRKSSLKRFLKTHKISLLFFVLSFFFISQASAATTGLNWENPNKNGDNPYKVTTDTILNSQTLMKIVGCTGIVNKVSEAITGLFTSDSGSDSLGVDLTKLSPQEIALIGKEKYLDLVCTMFKGNIESAVATMPSVTITQAISDGYKCPQVNKIESTSVEKRLDKLLKQATAKERREACFNGLAYTLAKNQLTSMTRETVSWINTGFSGNPMYVQNIRSLTNSIEKNIVESSIDTLANNAFPYGGDFSKTLVTYKNSQISNGLTNFLGSLTSDLSAFLTDKDSYGFGNTPETMTAKQRAMYDVDRFSNDFSVGGWNGYLALTQREQNNPLGFTMMATQYVADRINQQSNEMKDEISQNDGFLSQKECTSWKLNDENGKPETDYNGNQKTSTTRRNAESYPYDECYLWKTITPGSIIKDKLSVYINSPERQLELADDINSVLNSLFTKLIENFRSEGLLGLSQEKYSTVDDLIGYGANGAGIQYIESDNTGFWTPSYSTSSYDSSNFNILKDLGNTYYHDSVKKIGTWDARTNSAKDLNGGSFKDKDGETLPELNVGLGVYNYDEKGYVSPYYYLTVGTAGSTKLFNNGYNGWAVGDRAFWNGSDWQNWKAGQQSPIKKRGIIQIQKDYGIAAKEILKVLPGVMPKIGELDYCIPGPNPSFETISRDTASAFTSYVNSLSSSYSPGGFFKRDSTSFTLAKPGDEAYDNYAKIFTENGLSSLFDIIKTLVPWTDLLAFENTYKSKGAESDAKTRVTEKLQEEFSAINKFYTNYTKSILNGVYGKMRDKYLENESSSDLTVSTEYVPMIEDGYAMTKDIIEKSQEISDKLIAYKTDIATAENNTAKLNIIKNEVDKIVIAAQARRNEKLRTIVIPLIKQKYANSRPNMTDAEAFDQYKTDYSDCFDEEYIDYLDYGDIVTNSEDESTRCFDNLDNDLDGLIDFKDQDCVNAMKPNITITATPNPVKIGKDTTISWNSENTTSCTFKKNMISVIARTTSGSVTEKINIPATYRVSCVGVNGESISKDLTVLIKL